MELVLQATVGKRPCTAHGHPCMDHRLPCMMSHVRHITEEWLHRTRLVGELHLVEAAVFGILPMPTPRPGECVTSVPTPRPGGRVTFVQFSLLFTILLMKVDKSKNILCNISLLVEVRKKEFIGVKSVESRGSLFMAWGVFCIWYLPYFYTFAASWDVFSIWYLPYFFYTFSASWDVLSIWYLPYFYTFAAPCVLWLISILAESGTEDWWIQLNWQVKKSVINRERIRTDRRTLKKKSKMRKWKKAWWMIQN